MKENEFNLEVEEIESIEFLGERETLDICVEDTHMFFANDIYTHNSGFNVEVADEQNIGKAIEVYQVCDWMVMLTQTVTMLEQGLVNAVLLKNRLGKKGVMVECDYDPNKGTFIETREVQRSVLFDRKDKVEIQKGITSALGKIDRMKFSNNKKD